MGNNTLKYLCYIIMFKGAKPGTAVVTRAKHARKTYRKNTPRDRVSFVIRVSTFVRGSDRKVISRGVTY